MKSRIQMMTFALSIMAVPSSAQEVSHIGLLSSRDDAPRRMDAERPGWRSYAERRNE